MKYVKNILIVLALLPLVSCNDLFEVSNSSFIKIYGENLGSVPRGFFQKDDGGFVIYGSTNKNVYGGGFTETDEVPTIIVTDAFGNQILSRQYPFSNLEYEHNQLKGYILDIELAYFYDMLPLANGNYFATISSSSKVDTEFGILSSDEEHFAILDRDFNIIKYGIFNDYAPVIDRIHFFPLTYSIPNSDDILVLMRQSRVLNNLSVVRPTDHYAIYRISIEAEIIWRKSFDSKYNLRANDLTFDEAGNIVVTGRDFSTECNQSFIDVIDINTQGKKSSNPISPQDEWHRSTSIIKTKNGYVIQDFSIVDNQNVPSCMAADPDEPTEVNLANGSLWFLNNQFMVTDSTEVIRGIFFIETFDDKPYLIQNADEGYTVGYNEGIDSEGKPSAVIIKTDKNGIVKWIYREPHAQLKANVIETADGGIVFMVAKEFNITGSKWALIKLNKDGQLD
jgi:hypothetical protein